MDEHQLFGFPEWMPPPPNTTRIGNDGIWASARRHNVCLAYDTKWVTGVENVDDDRVCPTDRAY
jgi:hypothetical protein